MTALGRRHAVSRELRELFGERTPGRKTSRTVTNRRTPDQMPEQVLRFQLPTTMSLGIAPGPIKGLIGVMVQEQGWVEVRGRDRGFVCQQAAAVIKLTAKDRPAGRIFASWMRGESKEEFEIVYGTGKPLVAITGYSMRPFFTEGR